MDDISDETLMAYADGLLDDDASDRVRAAVAADVDLQRRLEPFVVTGPEMASLFVEPLVEPIPARLIAAVLWEKSFKAPEQPATWFERLSATVRQLVSPTQLIFAGGCTASVAVGLAVGMWMSLPSDAPLLAHGTTLRAGGALHAALETRRSGTSVLVEGVDAKPLLSFRSATGWCREYEIAASGQGRHSGVACRQADGGWTIAAHAPVAGGPNATSGVRPSSRAEPSPAVEGAIDKLMISDAPATADEETTALRSGWRSN